METKITVIGGGNMGGALIEGFIQSGKYPASNISLGSPSATEREKFAAMGVNVYEKNTDAVKDADITIIAVKPYLVEEVGAELRFELKPDKIVVSIAAGLSLNKLEEIFGTDVVLFRVMPNIAAAHCASMTFVACDYTRLGFAPQVIELFAAVGQTEQIDERFMDAAMVTASCGLAFAMRYIRACMEASIEMGFNASLSRKIISQTVNGATELLLHSNQHPEEAIDRVSTPGGITIVGLNEMEHHGFSSSVIQGHIIAYDRVKH